MDQQQLKRLSAILLGLTSKVKCPICLSHIENSVELECSHRVCETCLRKLRATQDLEALCPICRHPISKRAPTYKDRVFDEFGKFTNRACQLIKEKYAIGVEEIFSKNIDICQVIETSPGDELASKKNNKKFDGDADQPQRKKLNFDFLDANSKITCWLDYNQKKWDIVTQQHNTQAVNEEADGFEMPSVSQVPPQRNKRNKHQISHSLTGEGQDVSKVPLKTHTSFNECLDEEDNYNIEEVASVAIVKQVKLKVIQNMLEDECLANMEQLAQNKLESTPKLPEANNKKVPISSFSSDGWDRINDVKKTLKKREPKKLRIVLEDQDNGNKKKSPTNNSNKKKSPIGQGPKKEGKAGPSRRLSITPESKIQEKGTATTTPEDPKSENQVYNLSDIERYFDQHIGKDEILRTKSTPDIIDKENDDEDEDIYLLPTQLTQQNAAKLETNLHFVPPLAQGLTGSTNIALRLCDELKSCIASAVKFDHAIGPKLIDCFTNLLSYAEKLQPNEVLSKSVQTMAAVQNMIEDVAVQTDVSDFGRKETETSRQGFLENIKTPVIQTHLSDKFDISSGKDRSSRKSKRKLNFDKKEDSSEIISATLSKPSKRTKKLQVSDSNCKKKYSSEIISSTVPELSKRNKKSQVDNLKENQTNNISSSSILECSLASVEVFPKSATESQKSFKRIRKPLPDSDSDEGNPSKRKFLKDDLTVEFIESDKADDVSEGFIAEKGDPMILNMITKYVPEPVPAMKILTKKKPIDKSQKSEYVFTSNDVFEKNLNKFDKEISLMDESSEKFAKLPREKSQEHIFTGDDFFEENLDKFDNEIFKNEQTSKTYDTELDLVENTPIVNLKHRSNEKNPPIQILSKGAAPKMPLPNCVNSLEDVDLLNQPPLTLNRNLPLETEKCSDDVAILLEDWHEDDFLTNNMDYAENIEAKEKNDGCTFDDDIEDQLQNIQLTNFQKDAKDNEKRVTVLQNIRLRSPEKIFEDDDVNIISADDEDIVDATPKKKKASLNCRSTQDLLEDLENNVEATNVFIPPPPGFGDEAPEVETPAILDTPTKQKDHYSFSTRRNRLPSVQGITECIVTPDEQAHQESPKHKPQENVTLVGLVGSPNSETQKGLSFKGSMLPPSRPGLKEKRIGESEDANCSRITQPRYTPLVSTPRRAIKKPTIMTSKPNQKSILNFTSPSQSLSQKAKPCIMWSRIIAKDASVFAQLENKKLVTTSKFFTPSVTHLVVLVDKDGKISSHTAKILQAIAAGIWVVRYEWAEDCLKMKKIVAEDQYEALDSSGEPGPKRARLARGSKSLFKGFKFYLAMPLVTVNKKELEAIIKLTGGEVADDILSMMNSEEQFRVIVTESSAMKETQVEQFDNWFDIYKAITVDLLWFSYCIGQFKLISFRQFLVAGDEAVISNMNYPSPLMETVPYTLSEAT